jgi:hypothetical protein
VAPVLLPALLLADRLNATSTQGLDVLAEQAPLVCSPVLEAKPAADEVGGVGHRGAPAHRLPVHNRQRPRAAGFSEQQVVKSKVAVDQAVGRAPVLEPGVQAGHEPLAQRPICGIDVRAVTAEEPLQQL